VPIVSILREHNKISVPVISVLVSSLLYFLAIVGSPFSTEFELFELLIPVAVFLVMHYLNFWGVKKRVVYGFAIFVVVSLVGSAMWAGILYENLYHNSNEVSGPLYAPNQAISSKINPGIYAYANETPYLTSSTSYNITIVMTNASTVPSGNYWLRIQGFSTGFSDNVSKANLTTVVKGNGTVIVYYNLKEALNPDLYVYTFYITANNNSISGLGPLLYFPYSSALVIMIYKYFVGDIILFGLIFAVGIFIGRSIENAKKVRTPSR
jgi:hypothetical protein